MPLHSDITISASKFASEEVDAETKAFNEKLIAIWAQGPRWYEVGAPAYRTLRWQGKTPLPKPVVLPQGRNAALPSREPGRQIPYRVFEPAAGVGSRGVYMHIHGGGWVLMSEAYQDPYLKYMADHYRVTVVSIGYRLAPEDPWPKGVEDCFDAAEWLVENSKQEFGGDLLFTGGESAGAHLAILTALHLLTTAPSFSFTALLLHYGCYDLSSFLPHMHHHARALVIDHAVMTAYVTALLPNMTEAERRHPSISPFWADLRPYAGRLPPALFTCGSEDPLLDDSVMMGAKWGMWGGESVVRVYPGAPHGFIAFARGTIPAVGAALDDVGVFVEEKIARRRVV